VTLTIDLWPWKSIGFQILLRTKYVPSLVKIHLRILILECSQGCYTVNKIYPVTWINILQWILTKLGTYLVLRRVWNPIDFQGQRSRSLGDVDPRAFTRMWRTEGRTRYYIPSQLRWRGDNKGCQCCFKYIPTLKLWIRILLIAGYTPYNITGWSLSMTYTWPPRYSWNINESALIIIAFTLTIGEVTSYTSKWRWLCQSVILILFVSAFTILMPHQIFHICCKEYTPLWAGFEFITLVVISTACTASCKSNYHMIMTMRPPVPQPIENCWIGIRQHSLTHKIIPPVETSSFTLMKQIIWWNQYSHKIND
jgi:hypothetical protein